MRLSLLVVLLLAVYVQDAFSLRPLSIYTKMYTNKYRQRKLGNRAEPEYTYKWKEMYVTQRIDNFGWGSDATFQEKVLYQDEWWVSGGPILLYAGNEGDIEMFADNSGYMWDLAPIVKGLLIFAEHRYYGTSLPFGNESYTSRDNLAFFTADQALADFSMLIRHIKTTWDGAENSKVIVFGGSYGGMLASWMRMKYPDIVDGAIASSAPIWSFTWECDSYARVATADFVKYGSQACRDNIRASWDIVTELGKTEQGQKELAEIFKTCNETVTDVVALKAWLENAFATVAMVNYPYPAGFLAPLPAWPIREMCQAPGLNVDLRSDNTALLKGIAGSVNVYYNYTGTAGACNHVGEPGSETEDLGTHGWDFQTCSEMTIPFCNTGIDDMFEPYKWDDEEWAADCAKRWFGVRPNLNWTEVSYWGKRISSATNILFSNGLLDPWSAGGVMKSLSPYQPIVIIPDGAHHLELRGANPLDTPACKAAREVETSWIMRWLKEPSTRSVEPVHA